MPKYMTRQRRLLLEYFSGHTDESISANDIIEELDRKDEWQLRKTVTEQGTTEAHRRLKKDVLPITAIREGEVPGIHEVVYDSDIDTITLRHSAKSRKGLALGALLAAEFLEDKKGYFTMKDLLNWELKIENWLPPLNWELRIDSRI